MRHIVIAIGAIAGCLAFQPFAAAGPDDCAPVTSSSRQASLVRAVGLEQPFALIDAGNCRAALAQFVRLAERGDIAAQNNVGVIYESGLGVHANLNRAREWYQKAAEGGLAAAQWHLAAIILKPYSKVSLFDAFQPMPKPGRSGGKARYIEALTWAIAAAENGHPDAPNGVQRLSRVLPASDVRAARDVAKKWVETE